MRKLYSFTNMIKLHSINLQSTERSQNMILKVICVYDKAFKKRGKTKLSLHYTFALKHYFYFLIKIDILCGEQWLK